MAKFCSYCNHSKAFHHKDGCKHKVNEDEYCDCMDWTEIRDSYLEGEEESDG